MKTPLETARRWVAQAENTLEMARNLSEGGFWSGACFQAEQTAQLALKAFLYLRGRRYITIHSVHALALECGTSDSRFLPFADYGMVLDRYYLTTRYPDALPAPAVPFECFTEAEARQALGYAAEMVQLVRAEVPDR